MSLFVISINAHGTNWCIATDWIKEPIVNNCWNFAGTEENVPSMKIVFEVLNKLSNSTVENIQIVLSSPLTVQECWYWRKSFLSTFGPSSVYL